MVNHLGSRWRLSVASEVEALARVAAQAGTQGSVVVAEMPGAVTALHVAAGDTVEAGDVLVVMEAMKLIFPLTAPRAGTVAAVRCEVGEIVPRGRTLVELGTARHAGRCRIQGELIPTFEEPPCADCISRNLQSACTSSMP